VRKLIILCLLSFFLTSCNRKDFIKLGEWSCGNGQLQLFKVDLVQYDYTAKYAALKFMDKKSIELDGNAINNGMPYDTSVYLGKPFQWIDTSTTFSTRYGSSEAYTRVIVYIPPHEFTQAEFYHFSECVKSNSNAIIKAAEADSSFWPNKIAAMVYGNLPDFTERYSKNKNDYYEIKPDGTISHIRKENGTTIYSDQGFGSRKVIMPGKKLQITDSLKINLTTLKEYKNQKGRSVADDFTIEYSPEQKIIQPISK
jgi:hypothetical protein